MSKSKLFLAIGLLATVSLVAVMASSCESVAVRKLDKQVEAMNKECPINFKNGSDLVSVKYDKKENQVEYVYMINELYANVDSLRSSKDALHDQLILLIQEDAVAELVDMLIAAKASFKVVFQMPSSRRSLPITLTAQEVKDVKSSNLTTLERQRMIVANMLKLQRHEIPRIVADGIELKKMEIEDDNVVYYYEVDEKSKKLSLKDNLNEEDLEEVKYQIRKGVRDDVNDQEMIKVIYEAGLGVKFRYYGNVTQEGFDIDMTPAELRKMIP